MKVVFVVGPTASGKSQFSQRMAGRFHGEILNADSVQIYQGLDVGSAKPTVIERQVVPHHLFDFVKVGGTYTAGDYRRNSLACLDKLDAEGCEVALVVGGTGFYLQALLRGMYDVPEISLQTRNTVQKKLAAEGLAQLFAQLEAVDPVTAEKIGPHDTYRILRSIEVYLESGQTWSKLVQEFSQRSTVFPYKYLKVGLTIERETLKPMVVRRAEMMLAAGWIEEVTGLLQQVSPNWAPLKSVGYAQVLAYLQGDLDKKELVPEITKATMALAKRQMTWFRRDPEIKWFHAMDGLSLAETYVEEFLQL